MKIDFYVKLFVFPWLICMEFVKCFLRCLRIFFFACLRWWRIFIPFKERKKPTSCSTFYSNFFFLCVNIILNAGFWYYLQHSWPNLQSPPQYSSTQMYKTKIINNTLNQICVRMGVENGEVTLTRGLSSDFYCA